MEQAIRLNLDEETPAERLRIWRDLLHDQLLELEHLPDPEALRGTITARPFAGGALARWPLSAQTVALPRPLVGRVSDEYVYILALEGHGVFEQGGKTAELRRGDLHILDRRQAYRSIIGCDHVVQTSLKVSKSAITRRIGSYDSCFGVFGSNAPLQRLAVRFLRGLAEVADDIEPATLSALVEKSLDLIALMIGGSRYGTVEPSTHQAAMLLRIKLFLKSNVKDATLTIDQAAAALGMSTRYINTLLSSEGTSFGRLLLSQRLEGAHRDIMESGRIDRQITEVAFDWGFNNVSHFGRVFKDRFGMTPREAKFAEPLV